MSIEESIRKIVTENQSARLEASGRLARLIDVTAMGTADDFNEFTSELLTEMETKSNRPDGEVPATTDSIGDAGSGEFTG